MTVCKRARFFGSFLLLGFFQSSVWANVGAISEPLSVNPQTSTGAAWFSLVVMTLLVVLIAALVWVFKHKTGLGKESSDIQLLASRSVGPREQVLIVRVHDRVLVLGHTPSQLSLLTELDEYTPNNSPVGSNSGFSAQLSQLLQRGRAS